MRLHILSDLVGSLPYTMSTMHGQMNIKFDTLLFNRRNDDTGDDFDDEGNISNK
jgi:hypothetical protein